MNRATTPSMLRMVAADLLHDRQTVSAVAGRLAADFAKSRRPVSRAAAGRDTLAVARHLGAKMHRACAGFPRLFSAVFRAPPRPAGQKPPAFRFWDPRSAFGTLESPKNAFGTDACPPMVSIR